MSEAAARARDQRRRWAAAGSGHDRLIAVLRVALPMAVGVLVVLLGAAPMLGGRDISFVLAKDRVAVAQERMRVTQASYRGQDDKGQPFRLNAESAVQATSRDPVVRLGKLSAEIVLQDGPATIVANRGRYDMDSRKVAIDGPVEFRGADGYRMQTRDVTVDLPTRTAQSGGPVDGEGELGRFSAGQLSTDLNTRVVKLTGGVRLHIPRGLPR